MNLRRIKSLLTALILGLVASTVHVTQAAQTLLQTPSEETTHYNFVVLGDSQFHQPENFNRIVNDVALIQPDFVIQVGDMIRGYGTADQAAGEWRRFKRQIAPLTDTTFVPVPGNHDVFGAGKKANQAMTALYQKTWGADYAHFKYQGGLFVVLNTDVPGEPNQIGGKQLRWLAKTLEANRRAQPKFVFMHKPPARMQRAEEFHQLMQQAGVTYVIYGHHHHLHYTERDGVTYIMTNAAANSAVAAAEVGGFNHFLHVDVRDRQTSVAVVKADAILAPNGFAAADNDDLFQLTRKLAPENVALTSHPEAGKSRLTIPLTNASERELTVYVQCFANDNRWQFQPQRIAPVNLAPSERKEVTLSAWQVPANSSESSPTCELNVPIQARNGQWINHQHTLTTDQP